MKTFVIIVAVVLSLTMAYAAGSATDGKAVYARACLSCHGRTGVADAYIAKVRRAKMNDLGSSQVQSISDADLKKIITEGKGQMPPKRRLDGKSLDDVIAYMRSLKKQ